ncbi:MAG: hypothetical protein JKY32_02010 [Rhizobiales bacterium]|nr:hypothetical protein [Hyphomicrobiales bacterium]
MKHYFHGMAALPIFALLALLPGGAQADMTKSIYMNTAYCQGVAESYASRLGDAGSNHRAEARHAVQVAGKLESRGDSMAMRLHYSDSEGDVARRRGARTMDGLLPSGGAWANGGDVPIAAIRQYQQCVSIVE